MKTSDNFVQLINIKANKSAHEVADNLLLHLRQEAERLDKCEAFTDSPILEEYPDDPTPLQNLKSSLDKVENIEKKIMALPLLPDELKQELKIWGNNLYALGTYVGAHNQYQLLKEFTDVGLKKSRKESSKSYTTFMAQYSDAMNIMDRILKDFYSHEDNRNYKLSTLIQLIANLCSENGINFPKDRRGFWYKQLLNQSLPPALHSSHFSGAPKKGYRTINKKAFKEKYQYLFDLKGS